jgi:ankyrin repeat protein
MKNKCVVCLKKYKSGEKLVLLHGPGGPKHCSHVKCFAMIKNKNTCSTCKKSVHTKTNSFGKSIFVSSFGDLKGFYDLVSKRKNSDQYLEDIQNSYSFIKQNGLVDKNNTPLMEAVRNGNVTTVDLLIRIGEDVDAKNEDGVSALLIACQLKRNDIIEKLLSFGAYPNVKDELTGKTPLMYVSSKLKLVILALEKGAKPNNKDNKGKTAMHHLMSSSIRDKQHILELLLNKGGDPNIVDNSGVSPVLQAVKSGNASLLKTMAHNAEINFRTPYSGNNIYKIALKKRLPTSALENNAEKYNNKSLLDKNPVTKKDVNILSKLFDKIGTQTKPKRKRRSSESTKPKRKRRLDSDEWTPNSISGPKTRSSKKRNSLKRTSVEDLIYKLSKLKLNF